MVKLSEVTYKNKEKLIGLVSKYPELYDSKRSGKSNANIWDEIEAKLDTKVLKAKDCKELWDKLRNSYLGFKRQKGKGRIPTPENQKLYRKIRTFLNNNSKVSGNQQSNNQNRRQDNGNQQLNNENRQQGNENQQPSNENRQQGNENQPSNENRQQGNENQPSNENHEPSNENRQQGNENQQPDNENRQQGNENQQPSNENSQQGNENQQLANENNLGPEDKDILLSNTNSTQQYAFASVQFGITVQAGSKNTVVSNIPSAKPKPKAAPKIAPKAAPKIAPKAAPKAAPKVAPKATPKAAPKAKPKAKPKAQSKKEDELALFTAKLQTDLASLPRAHQIQAQADIFQVLSKHKSMAHNTTGGIGSSLNMTM